jgi:hypothetical protein
VGIPVVQPFLDLYNIKKLSDDQSEIIDDLDPKTSKALNRILTATRPWGGDISKLPEDAQAQVKMLKDEKMPFGLKHPILGRFDPRELVPNALLMRNALAPIIRQQSKYSDDIIEYLKNNPKLVKVLAKARKRAV